MNSHLHTALMKARSAELHRAAATWRLARRQPRRTHARRPWTPVIGRQVGSAERAS